MATGAALVVLVTAMAVTQAPAAGAAARQSATATGPVPKITVPAAGWAVQSHIGVPPGWTETWSTGALPDDGQPIALSSPTVANLDGQPSVVVGDRRGFVYAYHLGSASSPGTSVAGWPTTNESGPIDAPPSVSPVGFGLSSVLIGSGNDADPTTGGYQAFGPSGGQLWHTAVVNPPTDTAPALGVQAGMSVGSLQPGGTDTVAGSLGQVSYALDAGSGAPLAGWPFFNSDSTHSTAALADLYGTGQNEIIVGGDQSAGEGQGQVYSNGGHLRILSGAGTEICRADTNQVVDSSPAVGGFLPGGATGIAVGTGSFFPGASDSNTVRAYDARCQLIWSTHGGRQHLLVPRAFGRAGERVTPGRRGDRPGDGGLRLGMGAERGYRPADVEGGEHRPDHRVGGHCRSVGQRVRRRHCSHHRRRPDLRRPFRCRDRRPQPLAWPAECPTGDRRPKWHDRDHAGRVHRVTLLVQWGG